MSKHLVPWKRSVKGYKTGCQKVKHRFGPIKAGLMCLLSLSPTPFILVVPPGSCRGWTPAPRGWWILYINNKYPHDRKSSCCWHISCGVSMRWGELVWTLSPCFPHWRPGVRGTGLCVCVRVWGQEDDTCRSRSPSSSPGSDSSSMSSGSFPDHLTPSSANFIWNSVCSVRPLTLYFIILLESLGLNLGSTPC